MHKLEYSLFQIAQSLENTDEELSKDIMYLSSVSHNYSESSNEMTDISDDFMKKIRKLDPNFKD
ncbi:hypothetical protein N9450_04550 [Gammaproteobacteria bacterium]|nr:hypothetical protein [Gammaproteobacteria bacterium]